MKKIGLPSSIPVTVVVLTAGYATGIRFLAVLPSGRMSMVFSKKLFVKKFKMTFRKVDVSPYKHYKLRNGKNTYCIFLRTC